MAIKRFVHRAFFFIGLLAGPILLIAAENYIQLMRPTTFRQPDPEPTLEGSVDMGAIRRIKVTVEPFLSTEKSDPRVYE
ncbi:MAG: hypothetical protein IPN90_03095 [Elusimicrobia bacterium]|nr:hypothetical protein [Elusimicrobiota bacterium]